MWILPRNHQLSSAFAPAVLAWNTESASQLRLLGNGVVPQCAALAFRTLLGRFVTEAA